MGLVGRTRRDSDSVTIGRQRDAPHRRGSRAVIRVRSAAERPGAGPQRPRSTSRPQRVIKLIWLGCVIRTRRIAESKTNFQPAPCALVRRSSSFELVFTNVHASDHAHASPAGCARAPAAPPPTPALVVHTHNTIHKGYTTRRDDARRAHTKLTKLKGQRVYHPQDGTGKRARPARLIKIQ